MNVDVGALPLGAEVCELDLRNNLGTAQIDQLRDLIHERGVVVIRGQNLTPDQHIAFARNYGHPEEHILKEKSLVGFPELLIVSNIIEDGKPIGLTDAGSEWHTDMSYMREPTYLSMLYALEVPQRDGHALGCTNFISTSFAYETLDSRLKDQLQGRRAVHSFGARARRHQTKGGKEWVNSDHINKTPDVEHPVFRLHPYCKKVSIFATKGHTTAVCGMDGAESSEILEKLHLHCTRQPFVYRHKFRVGDLLIWDNTQTQHLASFDYLPTERRRMHRVSLKGSVPLPIQS